MSVSPSFPVLVEFEAKSKPTGGVVDLGLGASIVCLGSRCAPDANKQASIEDLDRISGIHGHGDSL